MDDDGYPDDEELERIEKWPYQDCEGLMDFVHSIWWCASWGWTQDGDDIRASTGGWSGNESLIFAMQKNVMCWHLLWVSSRRGGHYEFELTRGKALNRSRLSATT